ncbi:MAG: zeta toxin family protein [Clostridiales bacterium]|nr:zeta toxin family protein [Clostridiales bacterium]
MKKEERPLVIVISGPSGSGKSTIIDKLKIEFKSSVSIHFDDYAATHHFPNDSYRWVSQGANPKEVKNDNFIEDLRKLVNGDNTNLPNNLEILKPIKYIFVEEPFGRGREGMDEIIDYVIAINVPSEIALARRLNEWLQKDIINPDVTLDQIRKYISQYLSGIRDLYKIVEDNVKQNCDLIINGMLKSDEIVKEIIIKIMHIDNAN